MTPIPQFAESVKYTARPVVLIPVLDDHIVVMEAYGTRRKYICTIPSAELAAWAAADFTRQRSRRTEAMKPRPPKIILDLDIDFTL